MLKNTIDNYIIWLMSKGDKFQVTCVKGIYRKTKDNRNSQVM